MQDAPRRPTPPQARNRIPAALRAAARVAAPGSAWPGSVPWQPGSPGRGRPCSSRCRGTCAGSIGARNGRRQRAARRSASHRTRGTRTGPCSGAGRDTGSHGRTARRRAGHRPCSSGTARRPRVVTALRGGRAARAGPMACADPAAWPRPGVPSRSTASERDSVVAARFAWGLAVRSDHRPRHPHCRGCSRCSRSGWAAPRWPT